MTEDMQKWDDHLNVKVYHYFCNYFNEINRLVERLAECLTYSIEYWQYSVRLMTHRSAILPLKTG